MSHDFAVSNVPYKPPAPATYKNPPHVIFLSQVEGSTKSSASKNTKFICTGKIEFINGFVQCKGFYVDQAEDKIISDFDDLISTVDKEKIVEIYFPNHRIISIRSLIYKAVR